MATSPKPLSEPATQPSAAADSAILLPLPSKVVQNHSRFRRSLRILGPGVITGAADDDPSGIATYSQTGAQFGYGQVWTALYLLALLIGVQEACARIGAVTGRGLAGVVKDNYSR